jgi:hypothetical protein
MEELETKIKKDLKKLADKFDDDILAVMKKYGATLA